MTEMFDQIPWRALSSESVSIVLDNVFLLIAPVEDFAHAGAHAIEAAQLKRRRFFKAQKLEAAEMLRKEKLEAMRLGSGREKKRQDEMSYIDKFLEMVLDNINFGML